MVVRRLHLSGTLGHRAEILLRTLKPAYMPTTYTTHRRVNAPVEFKGLKGQYILFAGGSVIAGLFLFALLYIIGLNDWLCLVLCVSAGMFGIGGSYYLSRRYGVHGWRKRRMARKTPRALRSGTRRLFIQLKK